MIYIQKIQTNWTKKSRSHPLASRRNAVPERIPITKLVALEGVWIQENQFSEVDEFQFSQKKENNLINQNQIRQEQLSFEINDQKKQVSIGIWNEEGHHKNAGVLTENTWGQILKNRRYALEHTWGYTKVVYNLFYGETSKLKDSMNKEKALFVKDFKTLLI